MSPPTRIRLLCCILATFLGAAFSPNTCVVAMLSYLLGVSVADDNPHPLP